jgi:uncharacterized protein YndB with AHSA1/START domain
MIQGALDQIGAVTREITDTEREGQPARALVATQTYEAGIDDVWDALTNAERIPRWFLPVSGDLRLGGRYQLEGNAGGEILECESPRRLALTWEYGGQVSWLTVRLTDPEPGVTTLELEHVAHVDDERWREYGPGAVGVGWDSGLLGLANHLRGAGPIDPQEAMAWLASDEGKEFVTRSSDGWCSASIAAGTDEAEARAAADRTTAAYTAAPPPGESTN